MNPVGEKALRRLSTAIRRITPLIMKSRRSMRGTSSPSPGGRWRSTRSAPTTPRRSQSSTGKTGCSSPATSWKPAGATSTSRRSRSPAGRLKTTTATWKKLYALYDAYDWICPGHHGMPVDKSTLLEIMHADELILSGDFGSDDVPRQSRSGRQNRRIRVMRYKSAHIDLM